MPVYELGAERDGAVASTETPQPVLGVVRRDAARSASLAGATFVVVADRIADPGNAGTMLRSAEAAGADAVVLDAGFGRRVQPEGRPRRAPARCSMCPWWSTCRSTTSATLSHRRRLRSFGTTSHARSSHAGVVQFAYTDVDLTGPCAVVVGNEAHGLDDDVAVDQWITIPHAGRAESLNVAMAATVLVFEVARQREGS